MFLNTIELKNFRLHKNTSLSFAKNLNYIIGGNGHGKTTILEAIYYLCTTKNLGQAPDSEAVNFSKNDFEIEGIFKDLTDNKVRIYFDSDVNKKSFFLDDKQFYKASSIIGKFPVVILSQSDHSITQGSPSDRRKFVDSVISQSSETYLKLLIEYNKTLRQRSSLLTQIRETNSKALLDQLDVWTVTLVKAGVELVKRRLKFIKNFNEYVSVSYKKVMEEKEIPMIEYDFLGETNAAQVEEVFTQAIAELRDNELRRATNLVGPHRDDFIFKINDKELKKYGSQGQHKTFQIALRFGEFFFLKDTLSRTPIFLLDDVFGELDTNRAVKISEYLKEVGQAFLTITDFSNVDNLSRADDDLFLTVNNGAVSYA